MMIRATIEFSPSPSGIAEAIAELDRLAAEFEHPEEVDDITTANRPIVSAGSAAEAVFNAAGHDSRTRELLRILPGDISQAMSPKEIGEQLTPNDDGSPLSPAQVRAVMRNEKRIERTLRKRRQISEDREVLLASWADFEQEGFGRYYLSPEDRATVDSLSDEGPPA